jgi:hypothetical protein
VPTGSAKGRSGLHRDCFTFSPCQDAAVNQPTGCHYADCTVSMLTVIMLTVSMLTVIMLTVIMLTVIMLTVRMLTALSVC